MRARTAHLSARAGTSVTGAYGAPARPARALSDDDKRMIRVLIARGYNDLEIHRKLMPRLYIAKSTARYYRSPR